MLGWMKSLLGSKSNPAMMRVLHTYSEADAPHIEQAIPLLLEIGIQPGLGFISQALPDIAEKIASRHAGVKCAKMPKLGDWALKALQASDDYPPRLFENVLQYPDGCYDGMTRKDYAEMIASIARLAEGHWTVEKVDVGASADLNTAPLKEIVLIVDVTTDQSVETFRIGAGKYFDWSLVLRLNERLTRDCAKRFAVFQDGNATIVFLTPDQISRLNALCGYEFIYSDSSEGQEAHA